MLKFIFLFICNITLGNDTLTIVSSELKHEGFTLDVMNNIEQFVLYDTSMVFNNNFIFVKSDENNSNLLYRLKKNNEYVTEWFFWTENIKLTYHNPFKVEFSSSKINDLYQYYNEEIVNPMRMIFYKNSVFKSKQSQGYKSILESQFYNVNNNLISLYSNELKNFTRVFIKDEFYLYIKMINNDNINDIDTEILDKFENHPYALYINDRKNKNSSLKIGDIIPNFEENLLNGKKISNNIFKEKKYTIIDFWGTWCGPCIKSIPNLRNVSNKFKLNLSIYSIASEKKDNIDFFNKFINDNQMNWNHIRHIAESLKENSLLKLLNINSFPTLLIVDNSGRIIFKEVGTFDENLLINFLEAGKK